MVLCASSFLVDGEVYWEREREGADERDGARTIGRWEEKAGDTFPLRRSTVSKRETPSSTVHEMRSRKREQYVMQRRCSVT